MFNIATAIRAGAPREAGGPCPQLKHCQGLDKAEKLPQSQLSRRNGQPK